MSVISVAPILLLLKYYYRIELVIIGLKWINLVLDKLKAKTGLGIEQLANGIHFQILQLMLILLLSYPQLAELHVYILPQDRWIPFRRLARNQVIEETVSAGFVRVPPDLSLTDLRPELLGQLSDDLPENYVFIKSVGRNFTQVSLL